MEQVRRRIIRGVRDGVLQPQEVSGFMGNVVDRVERQAT